MQSKDQINGSPSTFSSGSVQSSVIEYTEQSSPLSQDIRDIGVGDGKIKFELELDSFCLRIGTLSIAKMISGVSRLDLPAIVSIF